MLYRVFLLFLRTLVLHIPNLLASYKLGLCFYFRLFGDRSPTHCCILLVYGRGFGRSSNKVTKGDHSSCFSGRFVLVLC